VKFTESVISHQILVRLQQRVVPVHRVAAKSVRVEIVVAVEIVAEVVTVVVAESAEAAADVETHNIHNRQH